MEQKIKEEINDMTNKRYTLAYALYLTSKKYNMSYMEILKIIDINRD